MGCGVCGMRGVRCRVWGGWGVGGWDLEVAVCGLEIWILRPVSCFFCFAFCDLWSMICDLAVTYTEILPT